LDIGTVLFDGLLPQYLVRSQLPPKPLADASAGSKMHDPIMRSQPVNMPQHIAKVDRHEPREAQWMLQVWGSKTGHDETHAVHFEGNGVALSVDKHELGGGVINILAVVRQGAGKGDHLRLGDGAVFPDLDPKLNRQASKGLKGG